jgi:hypothetical protein
MEYYQVFQNRAVQTAAVITKYIPTLTVNGVTASGLLAQSKALDGLAQSRDDALAASDAAVNAESLGQIAIHDLVLSLPHVAEGELDDNVPAESALIDLLAPVYAIVPRTTELALGTRDEAQERVGQDQPLSRGANARASAGDERWQERSGSGGVDGGAADVGTGH